MAAKPQKPPGISLKPLQNQYNNKNQLQSQQNYNNEDNIATESNSTSTTTTENGLVLHELGNFKTTATNSNAETKSETTHLLKKEINCNCSNISIMHLFHEMKQEFPTIPDTIVAQCVNENCHQRENCIQMLRNELELNPIPAQSYPAKVLHPRNNNNNNNNNNSNNNNHVNNTTATTKPSTLQKPPLQQKPLIVQQKPPLKPIKPIRTAPLHPPIQIQQNNNDNVGKINTTITKNSGGGENIRSGGDITPQYKQSIFNTPSNTVNNTNVFEVNNNDNNSFADGVGAGGGNNGGESVERNLPRQRPTTLNLNTQMQKQQQQQRHLLNIQLQQRFQEQRNKQLQQQTTQTTNNTYPAKPIRKAPLPPIAPKPAQYQINHNTNSYLNDSHSAFNHHTSTTSSPLSESEISVSVSLSTPSPTASSPLSSHNNSNTIHHQRNTSTSTPTPTLTPTSTNHQQHSQTKSPIRHRSVITLQPEPPYTRGFLYSPATSIPTSPASPCLTATPNAIQTTSATSSPTTSTSSVPGSSQKSFTSVNLTLRPPVSPTGNNSALQPSTIDITAGPGFSGANSGGKSLHYRSTSYDARLGYEQNFQITVTDEGGVFSASRIRPQQQAKQQRCLNQVNISDNNQYNSNSGNPYKTNHVNYINSTFYDNYDDNNNGDAYNKKQQQQQQFHNNNVLALQQNIQNSIQSPQGIGGVNTTVSGNGSSGCGGGGSIGIGSVSRDNKSGNMCLPPQQTIDDLTAETLQRQKKRRDRLAEALRARKKELSQVHQDINLLTGNIATEGLSERLDEEIRKLRRDCEAMLRNSSNFSQPSTEQELAINHQLQSQQQQQQQLYQQSQPFPRQRLGRPPPRPPPPRQSSLDIIQHHSPLSSSTPLTPPSVSSPNLSFHNTNTTLQQQQQQQQHQQSYHHPVTPSYYQQQSAPNSTTLYSDQLYTDPDGRSINNYHDEGEDEDSEYEEELPEPWECSMCTFRNHPQLNICETCENVRILPGTLPNLSNAFSAAANTAAAVASGRPINNTNNSSSSSLNSSVSGGVGLNVANANIEHDTNLVQQQLQHFALPT